MYPTPGRVLLTDPAHFQVTYVINAHMEGQLGAVDVGTAREQWEGLRHAYETLGMDVSVLSSVAGLPDMVFSANQCLPYRSADGKLGVFLSRMRTPERAAEVEYYADYFRRIGYRVRELPDHLGYFEGTGDALWRPGTNELYGGYGYRTNRGVFDYLASELGASVVRLKLVDDDFYHLDTCLSFLDGETALVYTGAFTEKGMTELRRRVPYVLEVPEAEARELFACNAHCPDGKHVLLQRGADATQALLRERGFEPVPLATEEYLKSGGSVFCMKLAYW